MNRDDIALVLSVFNDRRVKGHKISHNRIFRVELHLSNLQSPRRGCIERCRNSVDYAAFTIYGKDSCFPLNQHPLILILNTFGKNVFVTIHLLKLSHKSHSNEIAKGVSQSMGLWGPNCSKNAPFSVDNF